MPIGHMIQLNVPYIYYINCTFPLAKITIVKCWLPFVIIPLLKTILLRTICIKKNNTKSVPISHICQFPDGSLCQARAEKYRLLHHLTKHTCSQGPLSQKILYCNLVYVWESLARMYFCNNSASKRYFRGIITQYWPIQVAINILSLKWKVELWPALAY